MFNLHQLVAETLATTDTPDPHDVAEAVAKAIPARHTRTALAELLPVYVTRVSTRMRADAFRSLEPAEFEQDVSAARQLASGRPPVKRVEGVSWRERYAPILKSLVPTTERYKFLHECTAEDLRAAAAQRRRNAAELTTQADKWDALASIVERNGVNTVAELDLPTITRTMAA